MEHRHLPSGMPEHDDEPELGLPEALPKNERLIWQGSPNWRAMARDIFHVKKITIYFAIIVAVRMFVVGSDDGFTAALMAGLWLLPLILFALGILVVMAYLSARDTMYTITDKRVVMRIGIALTLTYNIPLKLVSAAGLHERKDGTGDIPLALASGNKIGYIYLWPHVRPWRITNTEPMLRCVPNASDVAQSLHTAWQHAAGEQAAAQNIKKPHGPNASPELQPNLASSS